MTRKGSTLMALLCWFAWHRQLNGYPQSNKIFHITLYRYSITCISLTIGVPWKDLMMLTRCRKGGNKDISLLGYFPTKPPMLYICSLTGIITMKREFSNTTSLEHLKLNSFQHFISWPYIPCTLFYYRHHHPQHSTLFNIRNVLINRQYVYSLE